MPIPNHLKLYFWDTDPACLDTHTHQKYIISRLLRIGDASSWQWVNQQYDLDTIIDTIQTNKEFTKKDRNFYSLIYQMRN